MFFSHWDELETSDLILFICFNVSGRVKTMFPQNKTKQKRFYMCRDQWFFFFLCFWMSENNIIIIIFLNVSKKK